MPAAIPLTGDLAIIQGESYRSLSLKFDGDLTAWSARGQIRSKVLEEGGTLLAIFTFDTPTYDATADQTTIYPRLTANQTAVIPKTRWQGEGTYSKTHVYYYDVELESDAGQVIKTPVEIVQVIPEVTGSSFSDVDWSAVENTMTKLVYDLNNSGVVDDAERLGGQLPEYYATAAQGALAETALQAADLSSYLTDSDLGVTVQSYDANTVIDPNYVATEENYSTTEKTKLGAIEDAATADQTGAEIKALYEAESDTNAFTDADKTKLDNIEDAATADQTGAEIKALYEAESDTNAFTDAEKTKLGGIEAGAEVNVKADWDALDGDAEILNKPLFGTAAFEDLVNLATAAQGSLADSAIQPSDIADGDLFQNIATQTANYNAAVLQSIPCDTSGGSFTVTLPVAPLGSIKLFDVVGGTVHDGFGVNPLTVAAAPGTTIMGASTYQLYTGGTHAIFQLVGSDWRLASLSFPDQPWTASRVIWVDSNGDDNNPGTLSSAPKQTVRSALAAAQPGDCIKIRAGVYVEEAPLIVPRRVAIMADSLRVTEIRPTSATKNNNLFLVDSDVKFWGLTFAGHQAGSFAIAFNPNADNTDIGANSLGAYILKSPYIQNCTSYTAQDDAGLAGSISDGTTGGGLEIDGAKCALNSPIRSMVVDSFTQVNLDGPGCLVKNDGYAQLVSFFATFCTYHVKTETGGQVNLSGGGTTDFGTYGLIADGYSPQPLFTGAARLPAYGAIYRQQAVTIADANTFSTTTDHTLTAGDKIQFSSEGTYATGLEGSTDYYVLASGLTATTFQISETLNGTPITLSGDLSGDYEFSRQGDNEIEIINFSDSRLGNTPSAIARPNAGQLLFPQLVFPRNASTGVPEAKTFSYTRLGDRALTYSEAPSPGGQPPHDYVDGGTAVIEGIDYGVAGATYDPASGLVTITTQSDLPPGNKTVTVEGLNFICQTSAYVVTSAAPIDLNGGAVNEGAPEQAGYKVYFYSSTNRSLRYRVEAGQIIDFRNRSQISAPSHTFEFVGSGTNYDALPFNGGVPNPANRIVEENNGRIYSSNTDEQGNFAVGSQFSVDGTTGSVTINTDQFNLSGLNFIGPFSRNGGISTVGEQLREISNNTSLIASTGAADGNTVPTQFAVKTYLETEYTPLTREINTGTGLTGGGDLTADKTVALNQQSIDSLALADTSLQPSDIGSTVQSYDANTVIDGNYVQTEENYSTFEKLKLGGIEAGATADQTGAEIKQLYEAESDTNAFTDAEKTKLGGIETGAQVNVPVDWDANSGSAQILNKPTLGTAAAQNVEAFATAAQGALADSAVQPSEIANFETTAQLIVRETENRKRENHTGTQAINTVDGLQAALDAKEPADATILKAADIGATVQGYSQTLQNTTASYTSEEETKLAGIEAGATADLTGAEIKALYEAEPNTNAFTDSEKYKLDDIDWGAEANVQSDWNAVSGDAQILNKPTLGTAAAQNVEAFATAAQGALADSAVQPSDLASYATAAQGALADSAVQPDDIQDFESTSQLIARETETRKRENHTGTQAINTVDGLQAALDAKEPADATILKAADIGATVQPYDANTVIDPNYVATEENYSTFEKLKLAAIEPGAEINVKSDWQAVSGDAEILNKPTLGTAAAQDVEAFATAAQGALADSAVQTGSPVSTLTWSSTNW